MTSKRLQRVTQWMSWVWAVRGSAFSSSHEIRIGFSTSPETTKSQVEMSVRGIEPDAHDRPFLGQVLAGWQSRYVVARIDDLSLRSAPEHGCNTSPMELPAMRISTTATRLRGEGGPDAASYLQAMVSNDVEGLDVGGSCEALLLTAKARVIAPPVVLRRGVDDFLVLTEEGLGERVRSTLLRSRFAAKCEIARRGAHVVGRPRRRATGIPTADYGVPAVEVLDEDVEPSIDDAELELLRVRAGTPRFGREIDDRVLPAEAGLDQRAVDFEKGCYPGQEPIARQHYRGRVNRTLRVLEHRRRGAPRVRRGARARGQGRRSRHERRTRRRRHRRPRLRARGGSRRGGAPPRRRASVRQLDLPSPRP